MKGVTMSAFML